MRARQSRVEHPPWTPQARQHLVFPSRIAARPPGGARPQVWIDAQARGAILDFFADLPLALERPDVRVVHACWDDAKITLARQATARGGAASRHQARIEADIRRRHLSGSLATIARQNQNPVKLLTSGPEALADEPFEAMGQTRHERRVAWWRDYIGPLCVFGHYWRILLPHEVDGDRLFTDTPLDAVLGCGRRCASITRWASISSTHHCGNRWRVSNAVGGMQLPQRVLILDDFYTLLRHFCPADHARQRRFRLLS